MLKYRIDKRSSEDNSPALLRFFQLFAHEVATLEVGSNDLTRIAKARVNLILASPSTRITTMLRDELARRAKNAPE
jgi:hypothetical protein